MLKDWDKICKAVKSESSNKGMIEGDRIILTEETKELIHTLAEDCKKVDFYIEPPEEFKKMSAEQLLLETTIKAVNAPKEYYKAAVIQTMLPLIDKKSRRKHER